MAKDKKEDKVQAAQGGDTTQNFPADGQNSQPQTNTVPGTIAKEDAAQNGGANVGPGPGEDVKPTDVNATKEPVATQSFLDQNPALVAAGIIAGDTEKMGAEKFNAFKKRTDAASLEFTGKETGEALEILLADLKAFEELDQDDENEGGELHKRQQLINSTSAISNTGEGIAEGKNYTEVVARYAINAITPTDELNSLDAILETGNPYGFTPGELTIISERREEIVNPPKVDAVPRNEDGSIDWSKTGVELLENGNIKLNGSEFTEETAIAIMQYAKVIDGKVVLPAELWAQMVEQSSIKPPVVNDPSNTNEGDQDQENYVYHGDFLTEDQINQEGLKLSYDWNEVTAPEHLQIKP